jgi:uncharacterized protein YndB with AHSA1/START domain
MSDRIEQSVHLNAPLDRVWRAISDHKEFGAWFKVALDQPFEAGKTSTGSITHPGYEHIRWTAEVVAVQPPSRLAFRWHPYAIDPDVDYSTEPSTLVEFTLREADGGTELKLVESGFDALPAGRRDEAFRMNSQGWTAQMGNVRKHVEQRVAG